MNLFKKLSSRFPELPLRRQLSYRELTTLGVGAAELPLLAEPVDAKQLAELLRFLSRKSRRFFVFGAGSNLVGIDYPYNGVGIRLNSEAFSACTFDEADRTVRCGAFVKLPVLARQAAARGLGGITRLGGIPGTLGGAVRMNAGANGASLGQVVKSVSGFTASGMPWQRSGEEIEWGYRFCSLPEDWVITEVVLQLNASTAETEQALLEQELLARREREPIGRTAGCVFKNISDFEPVGRIIDQCGLKKCRVGNLFISEKHANYVVCDGAASAADYLQLAVICRRAVAEKTGFFLQLEQRSLDAKLNAELRRKVPALRVNLLYGGKSSEREVSINSGKAVAKALSNAGFEVIKTDLTRCKITSEMRKSDVIYPILHGGFGEDGRLQKKLEQALFQFVGSGSDACRIIMDKILTKQLLDQLGIPTAKWCIVTAKSRQVPQNLKFPIFLKVPTEGSTVGIVKVDSPAEWDAAVDQELKLSDRLLAEEMIDGVEITVPLVNGQVLTPIEIRPPSGFYDYDAKYIYQHGHTQYFCPPQTLSAEVLDEAKRTAMLFYRATGARDVLRVDYIVSRHDNVPYVLEGNAIPGCTATSLVPKAARQDGLSFERMTCNMVYAAVKRPAANGNFPISAGVEKQLPAAILLFRLCCLLGVLLLLISAFNLPVWQDRLLMLVAAFLLLSAEPFLVWYTKTRLCLLKKRG